jgi:hypothetical protein
VPSTGNANAVSSQSLKHILLQCTYSCYMFWKTNEYYLLNTEKVQLSFLDNRSWSELMRCTVIRLGVWSVRVIRQSLCPQKNVPEFCHFSPSCRCNRWRPSLSRWLEINTEVICSFPQSFKKIQGYYIKVGSALFRSLSSYNLMLLKLFILRDVLK